LGNLHLLQFDAGMEHFMEVREFGGCRAPLASGYLVSRFAMSRPISCAALEVFLDTCPEMPVYVLAERLTVHDPEGLQHYLDEVSPTVAAHGGRYHVVSSDVEALEGEWQPAALAMFEFPTREAALAWWNSPEYAPLRELRETSASYNIVLAPGLADEVPLSRL
jgi:uncharacterized protein (DUF1330 family)